MPGSSRALVFLMGVTIRHWFNTLPRPEGQRRTGPGRVDRRAVPGHRLAVRPPPRATRYEEAEARALTPLEQRFAAAEGFEEAHDIVIGRCSMCHAREPVWDGIRWAPKGVYLETAGRHRPPRAGRSTCRPGSATRCRRPTLRALPRPTARRWSAGTAPPPRPRADTRGDGHKAMRRVPSACIAMPRSNKSAISLSESRATSPRISSVCCPRIGAGIGGSRSAPPKAKGEPGVR